jgi:siroheme synthase-like protein
MKTFPIMLDMAQESAVVIGGGSVGMRKVRALLSAGACVRLVAEQIAAGPEPSPEVEILRRPYEPSVLAGARLVFACTDDRRLNARIAADARRIGALDNTADKPDDCDFHLPATVRQGDVVVAVGTGGTAPALAAWLSGRLASALPERLGEFAALLGALRDELRSAVDDPPARMAVMKELSGQGGYELFAAGGEQALRRRLGELLSAARGHRAT